LWLGATLALFGGVGACGDDDGDGATNGTGGTASGGAKAGNGGSPSSSGSSGRGGSSGSGGSSGGAPEGGAGGSTGGIASTAGEGGLPTEGGSGPVAGNPSGGDAGSGTVAGAPNAGDAGSGQPGTGGGANGGAGGSATGGSDAGSGGGAEVSVEYRSCEKGAAVTRTCTLVVVQQGQINCLEGLKSAGWCVIGAVISDDVEACEAFERPSDPVEASAGEGTFTVSTQPLSIDMDVTFEFPASSGLPESVSVEADSCLADCVMNDCRP
jgi:hypothetical protein